MRPSGPWWINKAIETHGLGTRGIAKPSLGVWVWMLGNHWSGCAKISNCSFLLQMFTAWDYSSIQPRSLDNPPPVLYLINMLRFPVARVWIRAWSQNYCKYVCISSLYSFQYCPSRTIWTRAMQNMQQRPRQINLQELEEAVGLY